MRSREACSAEEGLLHLLEVTGRLHKRLLALDMIPIAAIMFLCIVQMLSEAIKSPNTRLLSAVSIYKQSHAIRNKSPVMPL